VDRIKQVVPIWKKEVWDDGEEWIEGHVPGSERAEAGS
jgi:molybdopterin synthase catalytic subunit